MPKLPIVAIIGPTGVGKTKLGVALAKAFCGEVVSVDSLQVYRVGGIMTARPTENEMCGVKHHLVDYLEASEEPEDFVDLAVQHIRHIHDNGKIPFLVGGSISLTRPLLFHPYVQQNDLSIVLLHSKLSMLGPRLDARIDDMEEQGLFREVQLLYKLEQELIGGPDYSKGIWKSIGYRELRPVVECRNHAHACSCWDQGVAEMKASTRAYAQDQMVCIWNEIVPKIQRYDMNFALCVVREASGFEEQVIKPAIRECSMWLRKDFVNGVKVNGASRGV